MNDQTTPADLARSDGSTPAEAALIPPGAQLEPIPIRWGLNDVMGGDDDSVTVMLSGPDGEPYWLELDPERAAVLRGDLAGPDAAVALPPADQTAEAEALWDELHRRDTETDQPHAADQTAPSRRAGLRDEIAAVVEGFGDVDQHAMADAVLTVLYREWPWLRAEAEDASATVSAEEMVAVDRAALRDRIAKAASAVLAVVEAALGDTLVPSARVEALAGIAAVLPAPVDRGAVLREAADALAVLRAPSEPEGRYTGGYDRGTRDALLAGETKLRRMADETAASETQAASTAPLAAGLPLVTGRCPACGTAGLFLGDGGYVTCSLIDCPEPDAASTVLEQPAARVRQDGVQR